MVNTKKAALIIIGNEILSGRTLDSNTQWIAQKLARKGISMIEVRVVPDVEERIIEAVNTLRERADYVFTTGGIGPTHDDITAETIAKALGRGFERNEEAYKALEEYYGEELTPARAKMAMMPTDVELIENPVSGAPGFIVENVYVMAGVPQIMQGMLRTVLPMLEAGKIVLSNTVMCTRPESELADSMASIQEQYKGKVDIGSYPQFHAGQAGVSIVMRSTDKSLLIEVTNKVVEAVRLLGEEAYVNDRDAPLD